MLIGTGILGVFPGLYYHWWSKRIGERPEDRDATMAEGAGRIDTFPGSSIWPFTLGIGCWFLVLALVFGTWFAVIGLPVVMFALAGGTAESRQGYARPREGNEGGGRWSPLRCLFVVVVAQRCWHEHFHHQKVIRRAPLATRTQRLTSDAPPLELIWTG